MQTKFEDNVQFLFDELYTANECFIGYKVVYNKQVDDVDALNVAPGFFSLAIFSFLRLYAITISRMYDNHKDSVNLKRVIADAQAPDIMPQDNAAKLLLIDECQHLYDAQTTSIKKLRLIRDKTLAHNDSRYLQDDIWSESGLTIGGHQSLIDTAYRILCNCRTMLDLPIPVLGMGVEGNVDHLISIIKLGRQTWLNDE